MRRYRREEWTPNGGDVVLWWLCLLHESARRPVKTMVIPSLTFSRQYYPGGYGKVPPPDRSDFTAADDHLSYRQVTPGGLQARRGGWVELPTPFRFS